MAADKLESLDELVLLLEVMSREGKRQALYNERLALTRAVLVWCAEDADAPGGLRDAIGFRLLDPIRVLEEIEEG